MKSFVYIVECTDKTLYTGWTTNIEARIETHNAGTGAKYTRGRGPVKLVYSEAFETKQEAMRREAEIKKLARDEKLQLVKGKELECL